MDVALALIEEKLMKLDIKLGGRSPTRSFSEAQRQSDSLLGSAWRW
jgi:hypothetical protein